MSKTSTLETLPNLNPKNISFSDLARRCMKGRTSYVVLEPGDATRYELYIVPFRNYHLRMQGTTQEYVLVSLVGVGAYAFSLTGRPHAGYVYEKLNLKRLKGEGTGMHTANVVAGFIAALGEWVLDLENQGVVESVDD
jgi:hypothetical protein